MDSDEQVRMWSEIAVGDEPAETGQELPPYGHLMSVTETARLLGVAKSSVYRWTSGTGQLPFFRFGENGEIRISGAGVRLFLSRHEVDLRNEQDALELSAHVVDGDGSEWRS
jgi:excisionase family DNA binding protein